MPDKGRFPYTHMEDKWHPVPDAAESYAKAKPPNNTLVSVAEPFEARWAPTWLIAPERLFMNQLSENLLLHKNNATPPKISEWHDSVTEERVVEAVSSDDCIGFCLSCGEEACNVEGDARGYTCDACDEPQVFGCQEILLYML